MIALLIGWGVPERFAKYVLMAALFVGILVVLGSAKCAYDRSIISKSDAVHNEKVTKVTTPANDNAAAARAQDIIVQNTQEQELHNVVVSQPDTKPSAASIALSCQRLRRQGADLTRVPACR